MRGFAFLFLFVACGELRAADLPRDGGSDAATPIPTTRPTTGPTPLEPDGGVLPPPESLAEDEGDITTLAVDGQRIFFAISNGAGAIYQCPRAGCSDLGRIRLTEAQASHVVLAKESIYWADAHRGLLHVPTGVRDSTPIVGVNIPLVDAIATDGIELFWENLDNIQRCPASNCTSASTDSVLANAPRAVALAAGGGFLVWQDPDGLAHKCSTATQETSVEDLGHGTSGAFIAAGRAVWVDDAAQAIVGCALVGCVPKVLGISDRPAHPVIDETSLYWRDTASDVILRCPATGCAGASPTVMARGQKGAGELAIDDAYVYWTTEHGVRRIHK